MTGTDDPAGERWRLRARCRGAEHPEIFYPASGEPHGPARSYCDVCPVQVPCAEHAIATPEPFGIWGGLSENERRRIRRRRLRQVRLAAS